MLSSDDFLDVHLGGVLVCANEVHYLTALHRLHIAVLDLLQETVRRGKRSTIITLSSNREQLQGKYTRLSSAMCCISVSTNAARCHSHTTHILMSSASTYTAAPCSVSTAKSAGTIPSVIPAMYNANTIKPCCRNVFMITKQNAKPT